MRKEASGVAAVQEAPRTPGPPRVRSARRGIAARDERSLAGRLVAGVLAFIWLLISVVPIYYMVTVSLRRQEDLFTTSPWSLPLPGTWENYRLVFSGGIARYFANSLVVTVVSVLAIVIVCLLAAYTIVRRRNRVTRVMFGFALLGLAIPIQATIIPMFFIMTYIKLYDSLWALILPSIAFGVPISILILVNFLRDVPQELFESMEVDGAGSFRVLWNLVTPLARPALLTITFYNALLVWNNFLFPLILTQDKSKQTLPLALFTLQGDYSINIPALMAAVTVSAVPMIALYAFGQRHLVAGLTAGFGR